MYIAPNTKIYILRNVPLDQTYDHTIFWTDPVAQQTYFAGRTKYALDAQSYQRANLGKLRISVLADNLYDCNYLMFQNTAFGNKWFYAFLKDITYINDTVSEVEYTIDEMQTWWFDYTLEPSFVEREHSLTDVPGEHLVPENLDTGEYMQEIVQRITVPQQMKIVVAATFDRQYNHFGGADFNGLYSALCFNVFDDDVTGRTDCANFILGADPEGIVSVFYAPAAFISSGSAPVSFEYSYDLHLNVATIAGHTVRNKKLLTYPYYFLYATNYQGESAVYPIEYFGKDTDPNNQHDAYFWLSGDFTSNPTCILAPKFYKTGPSISISDDINFDEMIRLSGFPQIPYATDSYKAWLAQTAAGLPYMLGESAIKTIVNPAAGAANLAGQAIDLLRQVQEHATKPYQSHSTPSNTTMAALRLMAFGIFKKHITREFAEIIDDYFDMYGYACHRVKVPNRKVRPHWTYTKTVGCNLVGALPGDAIEKIKAVYDKGITFWANPAEIGNYSLDNSPVSS